jgi:hypothetical protein
VGVTIAIILSLMPLLAGAQAPTGSNGAAFPTGSNSAVAPTGSNGAQNCNPSNSICSPLQVTSLCGAFKKGFEAVLTLGTPVAILFIIWSGFRFVLAQGNPTKLANARRNFLYTVAGIAIFLGAWLLTTIIASTINALGGSTIIACN